jgi:hypothetical protein
MFHYQQKFDNILGDNNYHINLGLLHTEMFLGGIQDILLEGG